MFCYTFKTIDYVCESTTFIKDEVLMEMIRGLMLIYQNFCLKMNKLCVFSETESFVESVEEVFFVSINFQHHFDFHTNASKSIRAINSEIIEEIHERTGRIFHYINCVGAFLSFFFLYVLFKSIQYKHSFMTCLSYKNVFITEKFHEIDERRAELGSEKLLPLNANERKTYIELMSLRLASHEYWLIIEKSFFVLMSTIHLCAILLGDYSLFWFLSMVQFYGNHGIAELAKSEGEKLPVD